MNHRKIQEKILTYRDAELPGNERREIDAHLAACEKCRGLLKRWEKIGGALSTVPFPAPSEEFVRQVMARLPENEEPAEETVSWPWPFLRWAVPATGYAFAIFLFFAALLHEEPVVNAGTVLLDSVPQESQWTFSEETPGINTLLIVKEEK